MFKDAVRLTQNDEFYLVTDTEGNIGIICFWNPIEETAQNSCKKKLIMKVTNSYIAFNKHWEKNSSLVLPVPVIKLF